MSKLKKFNRIKKDKEQFMSYLTQWDENIVIYCLAAQGNEQVMKWLNDKEYFTRKLSDPAVPERLEEDPHRIIPEDESVEDRNTRLASEYSKQGFRQKLRNLGGVADILLSGYVLEQHMLSRIMILKWLAARERMANYIEDAQFWYIDQSRLDQIQSGPITMDVIKKCIAEFPTLIAEIGVEDKEGICYHPTTRISNIEIPGASNVRNVNSQLDEKTRQLKTHLYNMYVNEVNLVQSGYEDDAKKLKTV